MMERACGLLQTHGSLGMIVPVSVVSTDGFGPLRDVLLSQTRVSWSLSFAERPSKLFTGVEKRLTIWLTRQVASAQRLFVSNYRRWLSEEREVLFGQTRFVPNTAPDGLVEGTIPKASRPIEMDLLGKISHDNRLDTYFLEDSRHRVYYTRKVRYFVQFFDFIPRITDSRGRTVPPSELKEFFLGSALLRDATLAVLNSNLFFWFFSVYSDVRNVNRREICSFPFSLDSLAAAVGRDLAGLSTTLMDDFQEHSRVITGDYGEFGVLRIQSFQPRLSKAIIDKIDCVLARHYGLTDEELDFVVNFDVKYRMGGGGDDGDDE
jgi:hypothetical protein